MPKSPSNASEASKDRPKSRRNRTLPCPMCNATFSRIDHLSRHMKSRWSSLCAAARRCWMNARLTPSLQTRQRSNINVHVAHSFHGSESFHLSTCIIPIKTPKTKRTFTLMIRRGLISDVLARHIRQCPKAMEKGKTITNLLSHARHKQTRSKKACNRCAESKLKCDTHNPCRNCEIKSCSCQYTREGYADPYDSYRIEQAESNVDLPILNVCESSQEVRTSSTTELLRPEDSTLEDAVDCIAVSTTFSPPIEEDFSSYLHPDNDFAGAENVLWDFAPESYDWADTNQQLAVVPAINENDLDLDLGCSTTLTPAGTASQNLLCIDGFELDTIISRGQYFSEIFDPVHTSSIIASSSPSSLLESEPLLSADALFLHQLDPVEAKCVELRHLVETAFLGSTGDATFITRQNLIKCTELFARHFSPNVSVLHLPTFSLVGTSPILLLAIMLVGACYSSSIPASTIHDHAMRLLNLVESQPVRNSKKLVVSC